MSLSVSKESMETHMFHTKDVNNSCRMLRNEYVVKEEDQEMKGLTTAVLYKGIMSNGL
jgi:hypothetical protein